MAVVSITGANQWLSDTQGTFKPGMFRGLEPLIMITIDGAPAGGTIITLPRAGSATSSANVISRSPDRSGLNGPASTPVGREIRA